MRYDHLGRARIGEGQKQHLLRESRAVHWTLGQARAWDSGKSVLLHAKLIAKTFEDGNTKTRTDLNYGCGIWRTIGEKVLCVINGRIREPGRVLCWARCGIDYVVSLFSDDLGVVPNIGPEEVDVGD